MVHTITEIKDGDAIIYHSMKYDKETKIIAVTLKIVEAEKDDEKKVIYTTKYKTTTSNTNTTRRDIHRTRNRTLEQYNTMQKLQQQTKRV